MAIVRAILFFTNTGAVLLSERIEVSQKRKEVKRDIIEIVESGKWKVERESNFLCEEDFFIHIHHHRLDQGCFRKR
jgi:hypothetical protein